MTSAQGALQGQACCLWLLPSRLLTVQCVPGQHVSPTSLRSIPFCPLPGGPVPGCDPGRGPRLPRMEPPVPGAPSPLLTHHHITLFSASMRVDRNRTRSPFNVRLLHQGGTSVFFASYSGGTPITEHWTVSTVNPSANRFESGRTPVRSSPSLRMTLLPRGRGQAGPTSDSCLCGCSERHRSGFPVALGPTPQRGGSQRGGSQREVQRLLPHLTVHHWPWRVSLLAECWKWRGNAHAFNLGARTDAP